MKEFKNRRAPECLPIFGDPNEESDDELLEIVIDDDEDDESDGLDFVLPPGHNNEGNIPEPTVFENQNNNAAAIPEQNHAVVASVSFPSYLGIEDDPQPGPSNRVRRSPTPFRVPHSDPVPILRNVSGNDTGGPEGGVVVGNPTGDPWANNPHPSVPVQFSSEFTSGSIQTERLIPIRAALPAAALAGRIPALRHVAGNFPPRAPNGLTPETLNGLYHYWNGIHMNRFHLPGAYVFPTLNRGQTQNHVSDSDSD